MNKLQETQAMMTTVDIADLTGKAHKNVVRDVENMLDLIGTDKLRFERIYFDSMNRRQRAYELTPTLIKTLITGYDVVLRHKVIVKLEALERMAAERCANQAPKVTDQTARDQQINKLIEAVTTQSKLIADLVLGKQCAASTKQDAQEKPLLFIPKVHSDSVIDAHKIYFDGHEPRDSYGTSRSQSGIKYIAPKYTNTWRVRVERKGFNHKIEYHKTLTQAAESLRAWEIKVGLRNY